MKIIQIVPRLPPSINGLGDYALNLACQLRQDFEIETHFIIGDPNWQGEKTAEAFSVSKVCDRSSKALASLLTQLAIDKVLLHYVGYGYAQRGCPIWLIEGLKFWHEQQSQQKVVTMFHEIHASSNKPWHSSFWLSPLQKKLASQLAQLSNHVFTNREAYAETISKISNINNVISIPVFSNIGELKNPLALKERNRTLVVFGHKDTRTLAYQKYLTTIERSCQALQIEKIIDIGISAQLQISNIKGIPIIEKGILDKSEISEILATSYAGFLAFPPARYLGKSTIFAAYCSHRLVPIIPDSSSMEQDGLIAEKHYLTFNQEIKQSLNIQSQIIADNAYRWYQEHSLFKQAQVFAQESKK